MQHQRNELVKVQLKVHKSLTGYPGRSSDYFVAVTGPGLQLGNEDQRLAPRCKQLTNTIWIKEIWLPKYTSIHYQFLVVKSSTNLTVDIEDTEPRRVFVGHKQVVLESRYNKPAIKGKEYGPTMDNLGNYASRKLTLQEMETNVTQRRLEKGRRMLKDWEDECAKLHDLEGKLKELEDKYGVLIELNEERRQLKELEEESRQLRALENEFKKLKIMEEESRNLEAAEEENKKLKMQENRELEATGNESKKLKIQEGKRKMLNEENKKLLAEYNRKLMTFEKDCNTLNTPKENCTTKALEENGSSLKFENVMCKEMEQEENDIKSVTLPAEQAQLPVHGTDRKELCTEIDEKTRYITDMVKLPDRTVEVGPIDTTDATSKYFSCGGKKLVLVAAGVALASCVGIYAYFRK